MAILPSVPSKVNPTQDGTLPRKILIGRGVEIPRREKPEHALGSIPDH